MSDIEKLFLAAYPLWPKQLLEKFSSLLSIEVAKFNPDINTEIVKSFSALAKKIEFQIYANSNNENSLLSPQIEKSISFKYYDTGEMKIFFAELADRFGANSAVDLYDVKKFRGKILYDNRIYENLNLSYNVKYSRTYNYNNLPQIYFYTSSLAVDVYYLTASIFVEIQPILKKFNGASTVLAMAQNGVSVDVDKKLLSEFVTFLNAYNKYSGELAAANSLQAEKNRQTMTDYKNSISEKLNSRKNELNDLRTQISFAARNETASAKRDMQSLALSAQSLILQLQDKLK